MPMIHKKGKNVEYKQHLSRIAIWNIYNKLKNQKQ
jgi:hypothetical protein